MTVYKQLTQYMTMLRQAQHDFKVCCILLYEPSIKWNFIPILKILETERGEADFNFT